VTSPAGMHWWWGDSNSPVRHPCVQLVIRGSGPEFEVTVPPLKGAHY